MSNFNPCLAVHPEGEPAVGPTNFPPHRIDSFGGPVKACWGSSPAVTRHGLLAYFIDFLKVSKTWMEFVDSCPLTYSSPNAPTKEEILATMLYSILIGQRRYAHMTALSGDTVIAGLFGVTIFRSQDSVRRAFDKTDEEAITQWIDQQADRTFARSWNRNGCSIWTPRSKPSMVTRKTLAWGTTRRSRVVLRMSTRRWCWRLASSL